ncbi:MAG: phosphoribosyltransferase family protein [Patescibacteria group bacterium]|nr:phosphoribosyltransferase family protein [Patescibacteria group bacterium]
MILKNIKQKGDKIISFFVKRIFPKECFNCLREGEWFCDTCSKLLPTHNSKQCLFCNSESQKNGLCANCLKTTGVSLAFAAFDYNDEVIAKAIKKFKYSFVVSVGEKLAELLVNELNKSDVKINRASDYIIIPTPLSQKRLNWRGFNQSEVLAKALSKDLKISITKGLKKIKDTKQQAELSAEGRLSNLSAAFSWQGESLLGKTALIVDDVLTTGSTIKEIARELKKANIKKIGVIVLAKG